MKTKSYTRLSIENFVYLPSFARYLLENKLDEYAEVQVRLLEEVDIPMMKFFRNLSSPELFELIKKSTSEFLTFLSENKAMEQITHSMQQWKTNQLPVIKKNEIQAEDITMASYLRKKVMLHFIVDYTSDPYQIVELIKEIDLFLTTSVTIATNTYINILKNDLSENTHLIEKINHTIPGAIYIFDLENYKGLYSNNKLGEIIGYNHNELNEMGEEAIPKLLHPDDQEEIKKSIEKVRNAKDGHIETYKYRIRDKNGIYRWLSNYESVFKRNEKGEVVQTVGITLNIDSEQVLADGLKQSEENYKVAEGLTHIGNYIWDLQTNELRWSDELYRIYEMHPGKKIDASIIREYNHPEDAQLVLESIQKAIDNKSFFDFYYRIILSKGVEKILHARGEVIGKGQTAEKIIGTAQDVTEKQNLIRELKQKESLYKQAEELANMGNWSWDLKKNKLTWTDHLYTIYGLKPQSEEITIDRFLSFVHPDDREYVQKGVDEIFNQERLDYTFRIITKSGENKIIRSVAQLQKDDKGNGVLVVGTERDITEKQTLIDKLRKSEKLYKQAQALAHVGNWSWDIRSNLIEWSDELYQIFGKTKDDGNFSYDEYLSLVHPDDLEKVKKQVAYSIQKKEPWEYTHKLITKDGVVKTIYATGEVLLDENGEAYMLIGTAQDISERELLIEKLQQSEALYKQAQALSRMGNFVWDLKTNGVVWSDEVYHIYNIPNGDPVTFQTAFDPILPAYKKNVQDAIEKTIHLKKGHSVSYAIRDDDGSLKYINLETDVVLDENGDVQKIMGTAQDVTERQKLIEKLQQSEKLFKQAQSIAHLGNWTMDVKTMDFTWSDEMYNIFEVDKGEYFNFEIWTNYLHPDDKQSVIDYYDECLKHKKHYDKIHKIILKNGKIKTIHRKGEFVLDENGEPVMMVGTSQDITADYRIQQELKDNQTFIRKITDATPSIIGSYNVNTGKYVFISEGLEKLLGYDRELVLERGISFFADIIHPEDLIQLMEKNSRVLQESNQSTDYDPVIEFTYRMRHKNGEYKWFHTYGTIFDRNKENKVEHILNISLDVSEQVMATQKIKEQEHFIQQIADASPTILYLYDVDKQSIVYINREIFFVLGYLPEEILEAGAQVTEKLYNTDDFTLLPGRKQSKRTFQQVDSMIQYECRMKHKDDEWRWILVREIVFKTDDNGNAKQILGAALDINRRKEMEKTILQNTMLLEQSNASLEEFAYVASHDLKEPLRKISTFGDRLVATQLEQLAPEGKMYLHKIVDASQRMQVMINDLLSISMITGNTSFENFSLQTILEETLQTLEFKIEQQNAIIKSDPLPEANIIPSQFRQLFQNLLSNSLKFIRPDVQPVINIRHRFLSSLDVVHYQLAPATNYHKLELEDNGIGFEKEYAGKIFAIFQRLHGRSEYEGSGIGLAICKKIVEHHGGIIYADGVPEKGATFTIILPA